MKIKSVSGFTIYVKNLDKTVKFYEDLGFDFKKRDENYATGYMNWYSINFITADKEMKPEFLKEAKSENKGSGFYINLSVDDVDETYKELIEKSYKPSSEPRDWAWGNREFVLRDPDGYKLVFFKKK